MVSSYGCAAAGAQVRGAEAGPVPHAHSVHVCSSHAQLTDMITEVTQQPRRAERGASTREGRASEKSTIRRWIARSRAHIADTENNAESRWVRPEVTSASTILERGTGDHSPAPPESRVRVPSDGDARRRDARAPRRICGIGSDVQRRVRASGEGWKTGMEDHT